MKNKHLAKSKRVIVVGGGITGLTAVFRLQQAGIPATLIEQDTRLGGKLFTEQVDGFIVEGGADSFLSRKPRGVALCQDLGVANKLYGRLPQPNPTYVMHQHQLYPLPEGLSGMIPTNLEALTANPLLSEQAKTRLMQELTLPAAPGETDESLAAFVSRRLGREVYERIVEPLMSGIYAGDGDQLSLAATFPQLRQLEQKHGSLIRGLLATPTNGTSLYPPFVSFPEGMGELVTALTAQLSQARICTGVGVTAVSRHATQYTLHLTNGQTETADVVILTTPAYQTAELLTDLDPALADLHASIPHASSVTVTLVYQTADLPHPLNSYGYVIPRIENSDVLACTWTSGKWAGRVPEGYAMIRVYLGRYGRSDILQFSDERLLDMALAELQKTMQITAVPTFHRLYRWPNGMPQYTLGHLERLAQISARLQEHPGLFLAGAAYRGVGIPDCIQSAETAVQLATDYLSRL